jgi:hypothetical protein
MEKHYLCKRMFVNCNIHECKRAHSQNELKIHKCIYDTTCKNSRCPFIHTNDENISNDEYYKRMLKYINPYDSYKTTVCRYTIKGCNFENCRKAHNKEELRITKCDCFRDNCPFYHDDRDENITIDKYYNRMIEFCKITDNNDKKILCRYIDLGCKRPNCPYSHSIEELEMHKCIFKICKTRNCPFIHNNEKITKIQYFNRMLKYIKPFETRTILCDDLNCKNKNCKYAHSKEELKQIDCIRKNCKKENCPFIHSFKINISDYYNKMLKSIFPN